MFVIGLPPIFNVVKNDKFFRAVMSSIMLLEISKLLNAVHWASGEISVKRLPLASRLFKLGVFKKERLIRLQSAICNFSSEVKFFKRKISFGRW